MKKKEWKDRCHELQVQNQLLGYLTENRQFRSKNTAEGLEAATEEGGPDFFERNARESNMIEAVKALTPDKEKEMELFLKEIRLELKQQSKRLKEVEKKADRCMSAREKEGKKIDSLGKSISETEHVSARLCKKVKKQHKALKLLEKLLLVSAVQARTAIPGESFKEFAKRSIKEKTKLGSFIKQIDAR